MAEPKEQNSLDFNVIARKWQERWEKAKVFNVEVDDYKKKKYYLTTPYPYMSGLLHLGHLFTYNAPETIARFKRMQGYNVLFKFAFHCTGTPIVAAAQKVKEKEPQQLENLRKMGIADSEIKKFSKPEYWVEYFPKETLLDIKNMGYAIDKRYTFITTSLNKPYDAMVRWQFNKLKEKGYVKTGKHPVVWCPKDNLPVGDHDRSEGEGETLKDFIWVKFRMRDSDLIIIAGTTRPDALLGQTHLWLDPDATYVVVSVNNEQKEKWVVSKDAVKKIEEQYTKAKILREIKATELIGKWARGPLVDYDLYIVPAAFIDSKIGSGIVYSALEDPVDLIECHDLQKNPMLIKKYNLDPKVIASLKPISIINVDGMSDNLGQDMITKYQIKSSNEKDKVEEAKGELNRTVFRKGIMKKNCGKYAGMTIPNAQEKIKKDLIAADDAVMFYELTGKVVCRCLTECTIKMVENQWFIEYNDEEWKTSAHTCLDKMTLYPELIRKQFDYVIDWLNRWACTREYGLGTKLPWDEKWLIESLSDSTLQMAYCTIAKYLEHPDDYNINRSSIEKLNDEFFDYVFLGKGKPEAVAKSTGISKELIQKMHKEFSYWYPFDFRNSAKDLLQNHLSFCIFNHTALFPEKYWPKAFIINGRIMVDNEKMSKSKGNFFTMRELYTKHGPDIVRLTAANAGEGVDDANYDMVFLETAKKKLTELHDFINQNYNKGRATKLNIDRWFESIINATIEKTTKSLENMLFKSAVQTSFLDLHRHLRWYLKRTNNAPNKELINFYIEAQLKLLTPITPHFSEECWQMIGKKGFISNAAWLVSDKKAIKAELDYGEELISNTLSDIREVLKLAKIENPEKIQLFISTAWKYGLFKKVHAMLDEAQTANAIVNPGNVLKEIMQDSKFRAYGKDIANFLPKMISSRKIPKVDLNHDEEYVTLKEAIEFIKQEINCEIELIKAEDSLENKARQALPGKVAILVK